jgi:hypothetical protein
MWYLSVRSDGITMCVVDVAGRQFISRLLQEPWLSAVRREAVAEFSMLSTTSRSPHMCRTLACTEYNPSSW